MHVRSRSGSIEHFVSLGACFTNGDARTWAYADGGDSGFIGGSNYAAMFRIVVERTRDSHETTRRMVGVFLMICDRGLLI